MLQIAATVLALAMALFMGWQRLYLLAAFYAGLAAVILAS